MRLVDADALMEHYKDMQGYERCACNFVDDGGEPSTEWYCVEDAVENAPTIPAIPVEWLRNKHEEALHEGMRPDEVEAVEMVMWMWQKEQEA